MIADDYTKLQKTEILSHFRPNLLDICFWLHKARKIDFVNVSQNDTQTIEMRHCQILVSQCLNENYGTFYTLSFIFFLGGIAAIRGLIFATNSAVILPGSIST